MVKYWNCLMKWQKSFPGTWQQWMGEMGDSWAVALCYRTFYCRTSHNKLKLLRIPPFYIRIISKYTHRYTGFVVAVNMDFTKCKVLHPLVIAVIIYIYNLHSFQEEKLFLKIQALLYMFASRAHEILRPGLDFNGYVT